MHVKTEAIKLTEENLPYLREAFVQHRNNTDWLQERWDDYQETGTVVYLVRYEDRDEFENVMGIGFGTVPEDFLLRNLDHHNIVDRYTEVTVA